MSCDASPAPPSSAVWYDLVATAGDVLAILRLTDSDVDAGRINTLIPAAAIRIDRELDRLEAVAGPPPAPHIQHALNQLTIELYRQKDPNVGGVDPMVSIRAEIVADKQRWGVA